MGAKVSARRGVPEVPGLGTTWVERGAAYWLRRVAVSFGMILVLLLDLVVAAATLVGFTEDLDTRGTVNVLVVAAIVIAISINAGLKSLQDKNRLMREVLAGSSVWQASSPRQRANRLGLTKSGRRYGLLANIGLVIVSRLWFVAAIFGVGWFLALVLGTFGRYLSPAEAEAVVRLQRQEKVKRSQSRKM